MSNLCGEKGSGSMNRWNIAANIFMRILFKERKKDQFNDTLYRVLNWCKKIFWIIIKMMTLFEGWI